MFRRRKGRKVEETVRGLKRYELTILADYNGERSRGLVHTEAWRRSMAELQQRYDEYDNVRNDEDEQKETK